VFEGVPKAGVKTEDLNQALPILLSEASGNVVFSSRGEARKMIEAGGVSINKTKAELHADFQLPALIHQRYLVVQKGKKQYFLLEVAR
jgi:tyrosyl-tRNA synthetase